MAQKMCNFDVTEERTIIKLCVSIGKSPSDTIQTLQQATGKPKVCQSLVYKW
mgnify:FL=1